MPRLLLIDNHDSFTRNLAHQIARLSGIEPDVVPHDAPGFDRSHLDRYAAAFISPGPGRPTRALDLGHSRLLLDAPLPVFGVCLGMQALVVHHGGIVEPVEPFHGRLSRIRHHDEPDEPDEPNGDGLFAGLPETFEVVRYHSLGATALPDSLVQTAWVDDDTGLCMAVSVREDPTTVGVQFHPESILTQHGDALVARFLEMAGVPLGPSARSTTAARPSRATRHLHVRTLPSADPEAVFTALYGSSDNAFWLDSASSVRPERARHAGGIHILGDGTGPLGGVLRYTTDREPRPDGLPGTLVHSTRSGHSSERGSLFQAIDAHLAANRIDPADRGRLPALPGLYGVLGYALKADTPDGRAAPPSPAPERVDTPDALFVQADRIVVCDGEQTWLIALDHPENRTWADTVARSWPPPAPAPPDPPVATGPPVAHHTDEAYLQRILNAQAAIRAGETYEVCLTNTLTVPLPYRPLDAYRAIRHANPAPHGAFLRFTDPRGTAGSLSVLSTSPERFLRIAVNEDSSRTIEARPIKGTTPRGRTRPEDIALATELQTDEKQRAENLMIVDLLRNDLARVCEVGSVDVPDLFRVESYRTVHQLVSTITGVPRADVGPGTAVQACFPGGSMTGAPKPRTLSLLDALEGRERGLYSGALGYFAVDGTTDLSIVIRTLVLHPDQPGRPAHATLGVGGAITHLSDPEAELEETRLKGRILLETLGQPQGPPCSTSCSS